MLEQRSSALARGLTESAAAAGVRSWSIAFGSMLTPFFVRRAGDVVTNYAQATSCDTAAYAAFFHAMLDQGVMLAPSQFEAMFVDWPTRKITSPKPSPRREGDAGRRRHARLAMIAWPRKVDFFCRCNFLGIHKLHFCPTNWRFSEAQKPSGPDPIQRNLVFLWTQRPGASVTRGRATRDLSLLLPAPMPTARQTWQAHPVIGCISPG